MKKIGIRFTFLPLLAATLLALLSFAGSAVAESRSFGLDNKGASRVTFESDAPVENIVGITTALSGSLTIDLADPPAKSAADVSLGAHCYFRSRATREIEPLAIADGT